MQWKRSERAGGSMSRSFLEVSSFTFVYLVITFIAAQHPNVNQLASSASDSAMRLKMPAGLHLGVGKWFFLFSRMRNWRKKAGFQVIVCYSLNHSQGGNLGTFWTSGAGARERERGASKNKDNP